MDRLDRIRVAGVSLLRAFGRVVTATAGPSSEKRRIERRAPLSSYHSKRPTASNRLSWWPWTVRIPLVTLRRGFPSWGSIIAIFFVAY
jgi:hypothetical protein